MLWEYVFDENKSKIEFLDLKNSQPDFPTTSPVIEDF
jgi:hypothetical protein